MTTQNIPLSKHTSSEVADVTRVATDVLIIVFSLLLKWLTEKVIPPWICIEFYFSNTSIWIITSCPFFIIWEVILANAC